MAPCAESPVVFGGDHVDHWRGAIDQVHVYDRALSDREVAELHATGR